MKCSDVVIIYVVYSFSLKYLLNEIILKMMKLSVFLINVVCGFVVEEVVLIKVLEIGVIVGVVLDVFEFEFKIGEDLVKLDNVVLIFYIGNVIVEICIVMGKIVIVNVEVVLVGKVLLYFVY